MANAIEKLDECALTARCNNFFDRRESVSTIGDDLGLGTTCTAISDMIASINIKSFFAATVNNEA
ncbi:MAG: hypothetical protein R3B96_06600 [Pirellulaceae bacterium]